MLAYQCVCVCAVVILPLEQKITALHVLNVTRYHMLATKRPASGSPLMQAVVLWATKLGPGHGFKPALVQACQTGPHMQRGQNDAGNQTCPSCNPEPDVVMHFHKSWDLKNLNL